MRIVELIISLRAFFNTELSAAIEKDSGEILNKKNSVKPRQPGSLFPTLSVVRAKQANKNGMFAFLSLA